MPLEDIRGQTLSAIEVFSLSIRALKEHLARTIESRGGVVLDNRKTNWVLTVPAIWTDTAKHFMRTSAEMADIPSDKLSIVLEPEAASVYCQTFPPPGCRDIVNKGTKYIIVDIGGGTTDITVHEKLTDGSLKELTRATGDECGGTSIDNQYIQLIVRIFGGPFYNEFKKQYPDSYLSLIRGFESTKRTIQTRIESEYQNFTIPYAALNKLCQSELSDDLEKVVTKFAQSDKVKLFLDKLQIKSDYAKSFFKATTNNIVSVLRTVLLDKDASGVNYMLLVGGFANCGLVQDALKRSFPELTIIVPEEAGTAVLKGAVLLGYKTDFISSRVIRYTYRVSVARPFDRDKHDRRRRFKKDGEVYYKDEIKYTDDGTCTLLGTVEVQIPNPTKHLRNVDVIFHFGGTELTVTAVDEETKRNCPVSFVIQDFR
ncbi:unnamed protein product [Mytilus coruscus]|uniref:HSPA12A n=1 Tax=Mytilus coruscus TaxID=42192 RepID=A0A6J8AT44_MYTCO|nr:unnamed protein product [Mytilus coruscus]